MSDKHLKLSPQKIRGTTTAWFYEEKAGLTVVQECYSLDHYVGTTSVLIPWRAIRGALARKARP